jgi:hypothetical protein
MIASTHMLSISAAIILVIASLSHANTDFVAMMNSRVGTWEVEAQQTGPEKLKWTSKVVVTTKGSGASKRWEIRERIKFTDGAIYNSVSTTRLLRGGGWYIEGTDGKSWYYPDGKVKMNVKTPYGNTLRGRWTIKGQKTVHGAYSVGGYKGSSTTTILSSKRWRAVYTGSDGTRTVVNARKVR